MKHTIVKRSLFFALALLLGNGYIYSAEPSMADLPRELQSEIQGDVKQLEGTTKEFKQNRLSALMNSLDKEWKKFMNCAKKGMKGEECAGVKKNVIFILGSILAVVGSLTAGTLFVKYGDPRLRKIAREASEDDKSYLTRAAQQYEKGIGKAQKGLKAIKGYLPENPVTKIKRGIGTIGTTGAALL